MNALHVQSGRVPKRVLICYTELLHYRIDFLRLLASYYDLTVVHSGREVTRSNMGFREIILPVWSIGRFRYQPQLWRLVRSGRFDVVVFFLDLSWVSIVSSFVFCPKVSRRVSWGLWRTGRRIADRLRLTLARLAAANIFYSSGAAEDFQQLGIPKGRVYVARNSFHVDSPERDETTERNYILFIGSFSARKQNETTLLAFSAIASRIEKNIRLVFVGDGGEKQRIKQLANLQWCRDRIEFHPGTTNPEALRKFYSHAICSVSFGQAGLSVLQSFGHGVPFVTRRDAVSGGEIENIQDSVNGILCDGTQASLEDAFFSLCSAPEEAATLGRNALSYYQSHASVEIMTSGFVAAIEGTISCGFRDKPRR